MDFRTGLQKLRGMLNEYPKSEDPHAGIDRAHLSGRTHLSNGDEVIALVDAMIAAETERVPNYQDFDLKVDPARVKRRLVGDGQVTGVTIRAIDPTDGQWGSHDIWDLDGQSLRVWLRSRGGANDYAENLVAAFLDHDHPLPAMPGHEVLSPPLPPDRDKEYHHELARLGKSGLELARIFHYLALKGSGDGREFNEPAPVYVSIAYRLLRDRERKAKVHELIGKELMH